MKSIGAPVAGGAQTKWLEKETRALLNTLIKPVFGGPRFALVILASIMKATGLMKDASWFAIHVFRQNQLIWHAKQRGQGFGLSDVPSNQKTAEDGLQRASMIKRKGIRARARQTQDI